jgi:hypothetical protein
MGLLNYELLKYLSTYTINDHINDFIHKRRININSEEESSPIQRNVSNNDLLKMSLLDSTHTVLIHSGLSIANQLESIFDSLLIINVYTHPVDIIFAWLNKRYGDLEFYQDNSISLPCIFNKNKIFPYYAKNFVDNFLDLTPADRVVKMITLLFCENQQGLSQVNRNNVCMFGFDSFLHNNNKNIEIVIEKVSSFSGIQYDILNHLDLRNAKRIAKENFMMRSSREREIMADLSAEGRLQYGHLLNIWGEWSQYE